MHESSQEADPVGFGGGGTASAVVQKEPLITVPLSNAHHVCEFTCANSRRIQSFFHDEAPVLIPANYCRAFVAPKPDTPEQVWGFYSLSAAILLKESLSGTDERRASRDYLGYPVPLVRVGFMGRDDTAPKGFGRGLIIDAARRVHRNEDIAAWGIVLECEGGTANKKLWNWYTSLGFKACRKSEGSMYGPLSAFLPELQGK